MLARVRGRQEGVIEYLKNGIKSGRGFNRDQLDQRVTIDGNIAITDQIIKQLHKEERQEAYLHITLSFGERDLEQDLIVAAYEAYKDRIMHAYDQSEYNIYAEIHYPKIKSYEDKKTGETVERYPHVHIVLPKKNLLINKALNPFGRYTKNFKHHDAIQESINRKYKLLSPYDQQRPFRHMKDHSDFISRYKGDPFSGNKSDLKVELFNLIHQKNIRTMDAFEKELLRYGEVSKGKAGHIDEYLKLKVTGEGRYVRLKDPCFKADYICDRALIRPKPTDKQLDKFLREWESVKSHEAKHIHPAASKLRNEYYALTAQKQKVFLTERINDYNKQYDIQPPTLEKSEQLSTQKFEREVLKIDLGQESDRAGNIAESLPQQLLTQHVETKTSQAELQHFKEIRLKLEPKRLLEHFRDSHGLIVEHYKTFKAKDGSARINVGKRSLNVSDFCTQHMHQSWQQTKAILNACYDSQRLEKEEVSAINSISFVSSYTTEGYLSKSKEMRLNESIMILKYLQSKEKNEGDDNMALSDLDKYREKADLLEKNTIAEADTSLHKVKELLKRQQAIAEQLTLKMNDLVATKNLKKQTVEFKDKVTGKKLFTDNGHKIIMAKRKTEYNDVAAALTLAAEKFGTIKITGTKEFKQQVLDVAVAKNLNIVFESAKMQDQFIRYRQEQAKAKEVEKDYLVEKTKAKTAEKAEVKTQAKKEQQTEKVKAKAPDKVEAKDKVEKEVQVEKAKPQSPEKIEAKESAEKEANEQQFNVKYHWSESESKMEVKINGESPKSIPVETLEKIIASDRFLRKYSLNDVQSGMLDLKVAKSIHPVPRTYNANGDLVLTKSVMTANARNINKV